jgi:hypothetical protein
MQTSQKLKITTPANENQADFGRKYTKIKADLIRSKSSERSHFFIRGDEGWLIS